jgi:thiosulfate/3-mercaptopyruvate sulfurtransferase
MTPTVRTLISAAELAAELTGSNPPTVIDAGFDLADPQAGERAWQADHLPGSIYLHLERDLSAPTTGPDGRFRGRHPLPERRAFAATLGERDITPLTPVVALDRHGSVYAARLWWMLRWMGHADVRVLDGGLAAWREAGFATTDAPSQPPRAAAAPYPDLPALQVVRNVDEVAEGIGRMRLIDARAAERFRGEVEPLDPVAGHIPGALHRSFRDNLAQGGRFKPASALRSEFEPLVLGAAGASAEAVVHQCGSGVTACHNLLAMEHAGWHGSALYPGSWSEWCADPARPVARG